MHLIHFWTIYNLRMALHIAIILINRILQETFWFAEKDN